MSVDYDFNLISDWRMKNKSWRDIGKHYKRDAANVMRWFKREGKRRSDNIQTAKETRLVPKNTGKNFATAKKREKNGKITRRVPYGKVEPTFKQVDIQTIDDLVTWIQTYTPYMQGKWDNSNTRENARIMFFDVFRNGMSKMVGKPRDSGKSKVAVAVFCCILANYWYPQGILVNGPKAKSRIFYGIRKVLLSNKFRQDYGDIAASMSKQMGNIDLHEEFYDKLAEQGYVSDDPSIQISMYNGIVGSHPYVTWLEDILQSEFKNTESNDYILYEVYDGIIDKLSDRKGGTFTRKGMEDLYSQLPDRNILLVTRKAIELIKGSWPTVDDLIRNEEGHVIDVNIPEGSTYRIIERPGWTIKSLLIRRTMALLNKRAFEMWEREMQNNPILSQGLYFEHEFKTCDPHVNGELKYSKITIADPAFGKSKQSSDTGVITVAAFQGKMYVTQIESGKYVHKQLMDKIGDQYLEQGALLTRIENDFHQITNRFNITNYQYMNIKPFYSKNFFINVDGRKITLSKIDKIKMLDEPFSFDKIVFYNTCTDLTKMKVQYDTFDPTKDNSYDLLDVLASAWLLVRKQIQKSNRKLQHTVL